MPSRSSRSRPASRTSLSEPTGSASRTAIAGMLTAGGEGVGIEAEVLREVGVPVRPVVAARPDVHRRVEERSELRVGAAERIVVASVEPNGPAAEARAAARGRDYVVAREVGRVVESAGGRLAAGVPERGRVPADRAEARGLEPREVERAEAAH